MNNHHTEWKAFEIDYLKNCYHTTRLKTIAKELGRTEESIRIKAHRIGVKSISVHNKNKVSSYLDSLISSGINEEAELSNKTGLSIEVCKKRLRSSMIVIKPLVIIPEYILTEQDILDSIEMEYKAEDLKGWELKQYQILAKQNRRLVVI